MADAAWNDRVMLVTGAARGIGRATAEHLGRLGAAIALLDRRTEDVTRAARELEGTGVRCQGFGADQTREDSVARAIDEILAKFGRIDGVFANAGLGLMRPFLEITPKEWRMALDVNLTGTFFVVQRVVQSMVDRRITGGVVLAGSVSGLQPTNRMAHYAVAKAGVIALGRALARELGGYRIRVNVICPGVIRTEATDFLLTDPGLAAMIQRDVPLGSWGTPEDVGRTVAFLLGPDSRYINGAVITITGGNDAVEWWPLDYSTAGPPDWDKLRSQPPSGGRP